MLIKSIDDIAGFVAGDLTTIKEVLHPKNDGIELPYSLAHATVEVGKASVPHILHGSEVYIITEGKGKMWIDDSAQEVTVGEVVYIPPMANQYIENVGTTVLKFLCIVAPAWSPEEEEIL